MSKSSNLPPNQKNLFSFFSKKNVSTVKKADDTKSDMQPPVPGADTKKAATKSDDTKTLAQDTSPPPVQSVPTQSSSSNHNSTTTTKPKDTFTSTDSELNDIIEQLDRYALYQEKKKKSGYQSTKLARQKLYDETFTHAKKKGVEELGTADHLTIKERAEKLLSLLVNSKVTTVGVSYSGEFTGEAKEGNKDTITVLNVDDTRTVIKPCSPNEPVAKFLVESRALFINEDGSTPSGGKDYEVTYLSHEFLQEENEDKLVKKVKELTQKAGKDGKIPIIAIALHGPVSQPSAHESEERIIKIVQDNGFLSTEGTMYSKGDSSTKTPYARSWCVLAIGIITALEKGRIFLSLGGTTCFQDSMLKLEVAQDRKTWVMPKNIRSRPKKVTSKKPASFFSSHQATSSTTSSSSRQGLVLPRELSHYNEIQFTGYCSFDNFNRELAKKQLTPLLSSSKSKKLLVVGTGGENSSKHLAATTDSKVIWDIWYLAKFKSYNFGFGYNGNPGQSGNSSKKRSIEDMN